MGKYALELNGVTKQYKDFKLDSISFTVPQGSIVGLIGENGAGKSTTINAILGLIVTEQGKISVFNGKDVNAETKEHIGAVALSHNSKLLILDEATSGLDPIIRDDILEMFLDFIQDEEHSILVSSHITSDLEKIADYIVFIHGGKVLFSKPKDELLENYGIIKCNSTQFNEIDKSDIISYRKLDYEYQVLVSNRRQVEQKYPKTMIVPASIDEIMLMYVKGDK